MDGNVQSMDDHEIVAYLRLLSLCWSEGGIPDKIGEIGKICRMDAPSMAQAWHRLGKCFTEESAPEGLLINPRMDIERKKALVYSYNQSVRGSKGARARYGASNGASIPEACPEDGYTQRTKEQQTEEQNTKNKEKSQAELALFERTVAYLNEKSGKRFREGPILLARIRKGATESELRLVIDLVAQRAADRPDFWLKLFNTKTPFRPEHFDDYLQAAIVWDRNGRGQIEKPQGQQQKSNAQRVKTDMTPENFGDGL